MLNRFSLLLLLISVFAAAQSASAHEFSALIKAKNYAEAERAANARLATDPANADALITKAELILLQAPGKRIDEAIKLGEQCVAAHPERSECHEVLGDTLATKALNSSMFSAIPLAGRLRDAYLKAVELDPKNYTARFSLLQFYLQAPSIAGGGKGKVGTLVTDTAKISADAGKLLQSLLDFDDEKYAAAEAGAISANIAGSDALANIQRGVLSGVATKYLQQKKFADADRLYRELQKRFPDSSLGIFGSGRLQQEQGHCADAIPIYEKAIALEPRATIYFRMAQCYKSGNDKARAISAFEKSLVVTPGLNKQQRSDAEDQLKTLKN